MPARRIAEAAEGELKSLEKQSAGPTPRAGSPRGKNCWMRRTDNRSSTNWRAELASAQRRPTHQKAGELADAVFRTWKRSQGRRKQGLSVARLSRRQSLPTTSHKSCSRWTGVPVENAGGRKEKLLRMEEQLAQRVVGQAEAVKAASDGGSPCPCRFADPHRPIGSFMFLGPTGVGRDRADQGARILCSTTIRRCSASICPKYSGKAFGRALDRRALRVMSVMTKVVR